MFDQDNLVSAISEILCAGINRILISLDLERYKVNFSNPETLKKTLCMVQKKIRDAKNAYLPLASAKEFKLIESLIKIYHGLNKDGICAAHALAGNEELLKIFEILIDNFNYPNKKITLNLFKRPLTIFELAQYVAAIILGYQGDSTYVVDRESKRALKAVGAFYKNNSSWKSYEKWHQKIEFSLSTKFEFFIVKNSNEITKIKELSDKVKLVIAEEDNNRKIYLLFKNKNNQRVQQEVSKEFKHYLINQSWFRQDNSVATVLINQDPLRSEIFHEMIKFEKIELKEYKIKRPKEEDITLKKIPVGNGNDYSNDLASLLEGKKGFIADGSLCLLYFDGHVIRVRVSKVIEEEKIAYKYVCLDSNEKVLAICSSITKLAKEMKVICDKYMPKSEITDNQQKYYLEVSFIALRDDAVGVNQLGNDVYSNIPDKSIFHLLYILQQKNESENDSDIDAYFSSLQNNCANNNQLLNNHFGMALLKNYLDYLSSFPKIKKRKFINSLHQWFGKLAINQIEVANKLNAINFLIALIEYSPCNALQKSNIEFILQENFSAEGRKDLLAYLQNFRNKDWKSLVGIISKDVKKSLISNDYQTQCLFESLYNDYPDVIQGLNEQQILSCIRLLVDDNNQSIKSTFYQHCLEDENSYARKILFLLFDYAYKHSEDNTNKELINKFITNICRNEEYVALVSSNCFYKEKLDFLNDRVVANQLLIFDVSPYLKEVKSPQKEANKKISNQSGFFFKGENLNEKNKENIKNQSNSSVVTFDQNLLENPHPTKILNPRHINSIYQEPSNKRNISASKRKEIDGENRNGKKPRLT